MPLEEGHSLAAEVLCVGGSLLRAGIEDHCYVHVPVLLCFKTWTYPTDNMKHVAEMACMDTKLYCPFMEIYFVMPTVH
jgi:hypothetical protein